MDPETGWNRDTNLQKPLRQTHEDYYFSLCNWSLLDFFAPGLAVSGRPVTVVSTTRRPHGAAEWEGQVGAGPGAGDGGAGLHLVRRWDETDRATRHVGAAGGGRHRRRAAADGKERGAPGITTGN